MKIFPFRPLRENKVQMHIKITISPKEYDTQHLVSELHQNDLYEIGKPYAHHVVTSKS